MAFKVSRKQKSVQYNKIKKKVQKKSALHVYAFALGALCYNSTIKLISKDDDILRVAMPRGHSSQEILEEDSVIFYWKLLRQSPQSLSEMTNSHQLILKNSNIYLFINIKLKIKIFF